MSLDIAHDEFIWIMHFIMFILSLDYQPDNVWPESVMNIQENCTI